MLTDEEKQVVIYLRNSPKDSLKRDAANLIERQEKIISNLLGIINCAKSELEKPSLFSKIIGWFK